MEVGVPLNNRPNELRIRLTDTTHSAVAVSGIADFNLRKAYFEKLFSLHSSIFLHHYILDFIKNINYCTNY